MIEKHQCSVKLMTQVASELASPRCNSDKSLMAGTKARTEKADSAAVGAKDQGGPDPQHPWRR